MHGFFCICDTWKARLRLRIKRSREGSKEAVHARSYAAQHLTIPATSRHWQFRRSRRRVDCRVRLCPRSDLLSQASYRTWFPPSRSNARVRGQPRGNLLSRERTLQRTHQAHAPPLGFCLRLHRSARHQAGAMPISRPDR